MPNNDEMQKIISEVESETVAEPETTSEAQTEETTEQPTQKEAVEAAVEQQLEESADTSEDASLETAESPGEIATAQESYAEADQALENSDLTDEQKEEARHEIAQKIYKAKIDGEEQEFDVSNPEDVEELLKGYQLAVGAGKRFEEAAALRKQAQQDTKMAQELLKLLKESPESVLMHPDIGYTEEQLQEFAEKVIAKKIEEEQLTPEQKKIKELEVQLEKERKEREQATKQEQELAIKEAQEYYENTFTEEINKVLPKYGLPKSPKTVSQMAQYLITAKEAGADLDFDRAARMVKRDLDLWNKEVYGSLDGEDLVKALNPQVLDKVRKTLLQKAKQQPKTTPAKTVDTASSAQTKARPESPKVPIKDFMDELKKEYGLD